MDVKLNLPLREGQTVDEALRNQRTERHDELHEAWLTASLHAKEMASEHGHGSPEASKAIKAMDAAWDALHQELRPGEAT